MAGLLGGIVVARPVVSILEFWEVVGGVAMRSRLIVILFQLLPGDLISLAVLFPFLEP